MRIAGLFDKHLDKLLQTRAYLESVTETVEDFQIRRIEWAAQELDRQGEDILEWKILRVAGLRENCSDKVKEAIEKSIR